MRLLAAFPILAALAAMPQGMVSAMPLAHDPGAGTAAQILRVADAADLRIRVQLLPRPDEYGLIIIKGSTKGQPTRSMAFRFLVEGAPTGKSYQFLYQDMGMKADGLPPVPIPNSKIRFMVDAAGNWRPKIPSFHVVNWAKGEWLEFRVRSTDGSISKGVRFVPVP